MVKRKIRIRSGELEAWMEVTEEEYQEYLPPMVAAEKEGTEEPGSNGRARIHGRIL